MDKKTRSQNQNEGTKPCPRSTGSKSKDSSDNKTNDKSGTENRKTSAHSGLKFSKNPKKITVIKPFSFDLKEKEQGTPSCSTEKKVEKDVAPEPKDAEGKVHVVMDTLKISRSEESSSCTTKISKSPAENAECVKKEHDRCSRATKLLTKLFVEKPARAKSPSKEGSTASAKKETETVIKKECTRCNRNTPGILKTPKTEVKPSKGKSHLAESLKRSAKKECTRSLRPGKPQAEPPKDQKTEVKPRAKSQAETTKSDEPKSQPIKTIKTKPAGSKIAKLQQSTKSEAKTSKASQSKATIEVQVSAVDSTVTEITQNTYVSKESVVMSSQTSNTESFCITEESKSSSGNRARSESDLKSSTMAAVEEKLVLLNGSESGNCFVTGNEYDILNGKNIVSEILEEAAYEAESFIQTKDVQEIQKSTSKIPRKTQGTPSIAKMNGSVVKEAVVEQFSFENRCPNSMDQPTNHEESFLVN